MSDIIVPLPKPVEAGPAESIIQSQAELVAKLDDLLERYLEHLDAYQSAKKRQNQDLASGYLSLAQANFASPSRIRYGQDFYDERMKALRTVKVTEIKERPRFSIMAVKNKSPSRKTEPQDTDQIAQKSEQQINADDKNSSDNGTPSEGAPPENPIIEQSQGISAKFDKSFENSDPVSPSNSPEPTSRDPINWFGILVPRELRTAQTHFENAIDLSVGELLSLDAELRALEIEVRRARKRLLRLK